MPTPLPIPRCRCRYLPKVEWREEYKITEVKWNATIKPAVTQLLWKVVLRALDPLAKRGMWHTRTPLELTTTGLVEFSRTEGAGGACVCGAGGGGGGCRQLRCGAPFFFFLKKRPSAKQTECCDSLWLPPKMRVAATCPEDTCPTSWLGLGADCLPWGRLGHGCGQECGGWL